MKFSEKLRTAIEESGLRKKEVAERAGISQVALSKYINNVIEPKKGNLTKIAKALGKDIGYFMDAPMQSSSTAELEMWKNRALTAEKKLEALKAVIPLINKANTLLSEII